MDRIMLDTCYPILMLGLGFKATTEKRTMRLSVTVSGDYQSRQSRIAERAVPPPAPSSRRDGFRAK